MFPTTEKYVKFGAKKTVKDLQDQATGMTWGFLVAGRNVRPTLIQSQRDSRVVSVLPDGYCSCGPQIQFSCFHFFGLAFLLFFNEQYCLCVRSYRWMNFICVFKCSWHHKSWIYKTESLQWGVIFWPLNKPPRRKSQPKIGPLPIGTASVQVLKWRIFDSILLIHVIKGTGKWPLGNCLFPVKPLLVMPNQAITF